MMALRYAGTKECIILTILLTLGDQIVDTHGKFMTAASKATHHFDQLPSYHHTSISNLADFAEEHHNHYDAFHGSTKDCEGHEQDVHDNDHHHHGSHSDISYQPIKILTMVENNKNCHDEYSHQAPNIWPSTDFNQRESCYLAYDLVDHGAIFSKMNAEKVKTRPSQGSKTMFWQQQEPVALYDNLEARKQHLAEKFPIMMKKPQHKIDKHLIVTTASGGEQPKKQSMFNSTYNPNQFDVFVMKSQERSSELDQQMTHQTKIDQFDGELAITKTTHAETKDIDPNDGFDSSSLSVTNRAIVSKQQETSGDKRSLVKNI